MATEENKDSLEYHFDVIIEESRSIQNVSMANESQTELIEEFVSNVVHEVERQQAVQNEEEEDGDTSKNNDNEHSNAIDPVTGDIDWSCPCLKDAVAPPCGEYFKEAFSCFVKSQTSPKGEDCMDLFVAMQSCYMSHPEIYKPIDRDDETRLENEEHAGTTESSR